ncbi:hypothetical protein HK096_000583, partial [Nowakowskiella sp. JEL0078]
IYAGERNELKERHGKGKNIFVNGDVYEGIYQNGKRNGQGSYVWKNGQFENGKRHGSGSYTYANGDVYEGSWKNDLKHGKGVYTFKGSGSKKKGIWVNGALNGPGEIIHADHKIIGRFTSNDVFQSPAKIQFFSNGYTIDVRDPLILGKESPLQPLQT